MRWCCGNQRWYEALAPELAHVFSGDPYVLYTDDITICVVAMSMGTCRDHGSRSSVAVKSFWWSIELTEIEIEWLCMPVISEQVCLCLSSAIVCLMLDETLHSWLFGSSIQGKQSDDNWWLSCHDHDDCDLRTFSIAWCHRKLCMLSLSLPLWYPKSAVQESHRSATVQDARMIGWSMFNVTWTSSKFYCMSSRFI